MQFQFSFKHMDTSVALQSYTEEKIRERIAKFVTKPISAHVSFSVSRHQHTAHLTLDAGDGFAVQVEHTSPDMYASVDELVGKMTTQLKKHKEKLKDHKGVRLAQSLDNMNEEAAAAVPGAAEAEVDAGDIPKYEKARRRVSNH